MRQEHVCLFEKIPFEFYVCKQKETSTKLLCYKTKETLRYVVQPKNKLE